MLRHLYSTLFYLLIPLILLRLLWRSFTSFGYRLRWRERFGFFELPSKYKHAIWIHAVSVGEAVAAEELIKKIQNRYPDHQIVLTTMTVTGSQRVQEVWGKKVFHVYLPYDLPGAVKRFLKKVDPKVLIVMETELWPNFLYYCDQFHIPVLLANARLSDRSAKGYMRFSGFISNLLKNVSIIAAQSSADLKNFEQLGVPKEKIQVVGNTKFDMPFPASMKEGGEILRQEIGASRPVWIAASTHSGEDELVLKAFNRVKEEFPECLLILVPRHPERFMPVANLCKRNNYSIILRSSGERCQRSTDVFLGDTMGELMLFYAASDVAFVGGSLLNMYGGHNLLEPAIFSLPIISGHSVFNFLEVVRLLKEANAVVLVQNEEELSNQVRCFLNEDQRRQEFGERAKEVVDANKGSAERQFKLVQALLNSKESSRERC